MNRVLLAALKKVISEYSVEIKDLKWLSKLEPINKIDRKYSKEIADSLKEKGWEGPPILYSRAHNRAITGSYRIAAAQILLNDSEYEFDIDVEAIDVDDYLDTYCEEQDCTIDQLPYDNLHLIFQDTDIEDVVKKNVEW